MTNEQVSIKELLERDIEDVLQWAYSLNGKEPHLESDLKEMHSILLDKKQLLVTQLKIVQAVQAMHFEIPRASVAYATLVQLLNSPHPLAI